MNETKRVKAREAQLSDAVAEAVRAYETVDEYPYSHDALVAAVMAVMTLRTQQSAQAEYRAQKPKDTKLPYRRVLGTLSHIVSMIDHGSVRIARSAAVEMIEEIRRVQEKPVSETSQSLCVECGKPESDEYHDGDLQVAATECPESTVADHMRFHRFRSSAKQANLSASDLAWKIDEFFADREEYKDFTYSINGLAAALRHIGVAE